ncbi:MAG TPA: ester cyclase [Candidatus Angelobacter sp.]|jgi:ketosteroid isomerase-like protein|nr:ester cyclase [Candidatus Angelobacter sp.]
MATVQELFARSEKAFNDHDRAAMEALCADDAVLNAPGDMTATGRKDVCDFLESWWQAFPDAHTTLRDVHYSGDTFIEVGTFHGTQDGVFNTPMGDIASTHRPVSCEYVNICRCNAETVASQYLVFDRLQLLEQLGLIPAPAATA